MDNHPESITAKWRQRNDLFKSATNNPFILAIKDGTVDTQCFNLGLAHDYLLTKSLMQFAGALNVKCDAEVDGWDESIFICDEVAVFEREHQFVKSRCAKLGMPLPNSLDDVNDEISFGFGFDSAPHDRTKRFRRFLQNMRGEDAGYTRGLTVLWAIETAIAESFASCLDSRASDEMQELVARWGDEAALDRCATLQGYVDRRLGGVTDAGLLTEYENDVNDVQDLVQEYWTALWIL